MLLDWLFREGWIIVSWWLVISAMGLTVLPALVRLLPALPDAGYTLARPAGLLLIAFTFWFLAVMGFINNSAGSILFAWVVVLAASLTIYLNLKTVFDWRQWWAQNRRHIIITEVLFVVLLVGFAVFRAHQNSLTGTEKPMDLAFMTAIQQSANFPPNDPWLSGYAISYYYFGYVMAAINATLVGVAGTVGYNMHLALLFALTGSATFGVVTNLIRAHAKLNTDENSRSHNTHDAAIGFGLLGMIFLLLMSNFNMVFVELPYRTADFDDAYFQFWDTKSRAQAPTQPERDNTFWWWFDHARTITERSPQLDLQPGDIYRGQPLTEPLTVPSERVNEVIDEFPAFSFLLGDSHPHLMTLPFVLLALGLAVNVLFSTHPPDVLRTLFYGVCIGALIFLNTWDAPVYIIVIVGAEAVRRITRHRHLDLAHIASLAIFGGALLLISVTVYFPFLAGFTSQLGGILPNVLYPTRPQQMFLMFGPFILLLGAYIAVEVWRGRRAASLNWFSGVSLSVGVLFALLMIMGVLVAFNVIDPSYAALRRDLTAPSGIGWDNVNSIVLGRRIENLLTLIVMLAVLLLACARLFPSPATPARDDDSKPVPPYPVATGFTLLLIVCGVGLVLVPEFVYLRDTFQTRMNTVFKFYYQAWVLFSVAAAYAGYSIIADVGQIRPALVWRTAYSLLTVTVLVAGLLYFPMGIYYRMWIETGIINAPEHTLTLDGGAGFVPQQDYEVIMCLHGLVGREQVVVAEAMPRGSYNSIYARVGSLTGIPVIMGWANHQSQWRGTSYGAVVGTRPQDLDLLFTAARLDLAQPVIDRYDIDYIIYGATERQIYGNDGEGKFFDNYEIVCESQSPFGTARIYRVSRPAVISLNDG